MAKMQRMKIINRTKLTVVSFKPVVYIDDSSQRNLLSDIDCFTNGASSLAIVMRPVIKC